jgi:DNA polymerase elongation subunit (family B)
MNLYLDIETIPAQSPEIRAMVAENVAPPASMKKAETIAQWEAEQKPKAIEEAISKTALDGAFGELCCIGWAVDGTLTDMTYRMQGGDEATILRDFVNVIDGHYITQPRPVTVIGHNVIGFDIRFLWQRAIILGVQMPGWFPRDPKPWGNDVFDTMTAFAGQRGTIGLDRLAKALGLPGKSEIDGSMVGELWAKGEHEKIAAYCKADVELTREIHRRMMVAYGEAA